MNHKKRKKPNAESKTSNPFKQSKKTSSKELHRAPPSPVLIQDDEPDFPRGGGSLLSRKEEAEARVEAEEVFEKELGLESRAKDKRKKRKVREKCYRVGEDEWGSLFGQGITGNLPRLSNRVTWKIDEERQRVRLGMKKSYFGDAKNAEITSSGAAIDFRLPASQQDDLSYIQSISVPEDDGAAAVLSQAETRALVLPLQVSLDDSEGPLRENVVNVNVDNASEVMEIKGEKNRHTEKKEKQERELKIHASEERRLQNDMPKTIDEFEILIRSSPNSSFFWIKYMEFMLAQADVDKARSVAERALKTVNIQEEEEKLNIWVAYFNLENAYGHSPEEDVERTFKRALQTCDPKKLHLALLGLYERNELHKLADALLDKMTKKFKKSCKVWLCRVQHHLKQDKDGIQSVLNRALLSLPSKKHIKFISHTAIMEFKCGVPDLGRSMFEGILREHPKRTDIWSIYLDQEIRLGEHEVIRALFERATCLSLPAKKMKFLFKKYHSYEESQGDKDRIEHVKKKALEYLESSY